METNVSVIKSSLASQHLTNVKLNGKGDSVSCRKQDRRQELLVTPLPFNTELRKRGGKQQYQSKQETSESVFADDMNPRG